ncbi:MAG: SagB/ThcOx family dehydrogenase [bacterium]
MTILFLLAMMTPLFRWTKAQDKGATDGKVITLPAPVTTGSISFEQVLKERRSVRDFTTEPLTLPEISQLLWAAQGITEPREGLRTAPSAGALYPLEIYLIAGKVEGLSAGVYKYEPRQHTLTEVVVGDQREALFQAALSQECVRDAPAVMVITAVYERTERKYRDRARQYVHIEVGCAAQNVLLQAEALGLGGVIVGAFYEQQVRDALQAAKDETPLALLPVGRKK